MKHFIPAYRHPHAGPVLKMILVLIKLMLLEPLYFYYLLLDLKMRSKYICSRHVDFIGDRADRLIVLTSTITWNNILLVDEQSINNSNSQSEIQLHTMGK